MKKIILVVVAIALIMSCGFMINKDEASLQEKMENYVISNYGYDHYGVFTMNAKWENNDDADYFQFDVFDEEHNLVKSVVLRK